MSTEKNAHAQRDLYEILGVKHDASQEEIKRCYNELVLLYHPDKGGDPKKFKDLQIAYKILSNEKNRKLYTDSLSSTFSEIAGQYRDEKSGDHRSLSYDVCDDDFTKASTDEEKKEKKDAFMHKFDSSRDQKERDLFDQMHKELDTKQVVKSSNVPTYEQLLRQQEDEVIPPTINCLMSEKFDVNLFNQIFEQNKHTQCKDLEPYGDVREQSRTDLAPVDDPSIFVNGFNCEPQDRDFCTYKTCTDIDKQKFDLTNDVTRTRDKVYDDSETILHKHWVERRNFDKLIRKDPPPPIEDTHELSYQNMGLNFTEFKK